MVTSAGRNCAIGSSREKSDLGRDSAPLSPAIVEGEWGESVMLLKEVCQLPRPDVGAAS
jgi:hypothetical protein